MSEFTVFGWILGAGLGAWLISRSRAKREAARQKALDRSPLPVIGRANVMNTCPAKKELHDWKELPIMDAMTRSQKVETICMKCGVFSNGLQQFSPKGLENLKKQMKAMEETNKFYDGLEAYRKAELERMASEYAAKANKDVPHVGYREAYLDGYEAFLLIESKIGQKIEAKKKEQIEELMRQLINKEGQK